MTRWLLIIALTLCGLACLAFVVCGCAPSVYAQRQDRAMVLYDAAQERVTTQFGADDSAAIAQATTVGAAQDGLAAVRARYAPALLGLIAAQLAWEHAGPTRQIDVVPAVCAALALARTVGVVVEDGGLCVVPVCWGSRIDWPRDEPLKPVPSAPASAR